MQSTDTKIQIKIATIQDVEIISQIGQKTFIESYQGLKDPNVPRPKDFEKEYGEKEYSKKTISEIILNTAKHPNPSIYLIAYYDSIPVGISLLEFDDPPACVKNRNSAHFSKVYILNEYQGRGVGKAIFEKRMSLAREKGYSGLWLGVWDQNLKGIEFHQKIGFTAVGEVPWEFTYKGVQYRDTDLIMYRNIEND